MGVPLTRERIVDEFIAAAGELDLRSASTRVIARRLGVSIGAVQHHYPARADLLLDAFGEVSRRVRARVIEADFERRSADDWVAAMTHLLPLDPVRRAESLVFFEFMSTPDPSGRIETVRRAARRSTTRLISSQLSIWTHARLPAVRLESAARAVTQLVDGAALAMIDDETALDAELAAFEMGLHALLQRVKMEACGR